MQSNEIHDKNVCANHTDRVQPIQYPLTSEGYAHSINPECEEMILSHLQTYGLVVVPVLSGSECTETLQAFFKESNVQQRPVATEKLSLDPRTWGSTNWPNKSHFLVRRRPTISLEATLVRTHPVIHRVFAAIFGTDQLQTSIDRWGVMRGTVNIPTRQGDGTIVPQDHPEWRQNLRLHWDMNPWAYINTQESMQKQRYQALVDILDSPIDVGGFRAVPGSHLHYLEQWAKRHDKPKDYNMTSYRSVKILDDDPMQHLSQKIPIKAGDMLIFDSRLLHGTFPNHSPSMRLVQYVRMMPSDWAKSDVFSAENVLGRHPNWRDRLNSYGLSERERRLLNLIL